MRYNGNVIVRLVGSVLLGTVAAMLFLSAAGGIDVRSLAAVFAGLIAALLMAALFVVRDARPYLAALNSAASLAPEEGRRAAAFLARAPDRIAGAALVAGIAAVWAGELVALLISGEVADSANLAAPAVAGL